MVAGVGAHSHADRGDDFYATPPEAVASLLAVERKWLPAGTIWEPACGDGAIVLPLRASGFDVVATDLVDRGCPGSYVSNFLDTSVVFPDVHAVITNPPFKLAREFVDIALDHAPYVAMLLRLAFLEGNARRPWFQMGPLARVHVSSRRLPMMHRDGWTGPKAGSAVCHAWFVWDRRHEGRPEIQWFDWKDHVAANDNQAMGVAALTGEHYLIIKRGLYERPNHQGYTGIRDQAGRYTLAEAKGLFAHSDGECRWVHEDQAKEFMPAAWEDLVIKHLLEQRDALRAELASFRAAPAQAGAA